MFPPSQGMRLDIDAISQIFGSISIACWIGTYTYTITHSPLYTQDGLANTRHSRLLTPDHRELEEKLSRWPICGLHCDLAGR